MRVFWAYTVLPDTHPIPLREMPVGTVPTRETYVGRVLKGLNCGLSDANHYIFSHLRTIYLYTIDILW